MFFSAFMISLTAIQARYTPFSPKNSEEFSSASRSVKPGLIASGIVSAWTWAATLVRISVHSHGQSLPHPESSCSSKAALWRINTGSAALGGTAQERRFRCSSLLWYYALPILSPLCPDLGSHFQAGRKTKAQRTIRTHMARNTWSKVGQDGTSGLYVFRVGGTS